MQPSTPAATIRIGSTLGGVSLDLSAGISREAFETAGAGGAVGLSPIGIQSAPLDLDLPGLCSQMPELLAQGLQVLHRNLAAESLRLLRDEVGGSSASGGEACAPTGPEIDSHAENFTPKPGLEVVIRWAEGMNLVIAAKENGQAFESYAAADVETALAAASQLIRGFQPPRGLFSCRDKPFR